MKPVPLSQNSNALLDYALSRLSPDVFSHPVWRRFGEGAAYNHPGAMDDLWEAATNLQTEEPGTACQVLLLCAVLQSQSGQYSDAVQTTQQVITLAKASNLTTETIWAMWGACAVSLQQGNYKAATKHLEDLQAAFSSSNEWMLANLIDVIRLSLFEPVSVPVRKNWQSPHTQPFGDAFAIILNGLQDWGFSQHPFTLELEETPLAQKSKVKTGFTILQSFFSIQHWQGRWRTLILAFRGELRLQWMERQTSPTRRRFSLWRSVRRFLDLFAPANRVNPQMNDAPELSSISPLSPAEEIGIHSESAREQTLLLPAVDTRNNEPPEPTSSVMSISVHMLGTFKMTIADSTVKLPASRAASLMKYLLLHHKQNMPRDVLMDVFWPDGEPEMARNNLNVAVYSLRKALRSATDLSVILFEDGAYGLASNLEVWLDVEEFESCMLAGQRLEARNQLTAAIAEYEAAVSLYQGDFLEQNPYEEWTILDRERLRIAYLDTLDRLSQIYFKEERYSACRTACQLILIRDPCREDAHCLLMRCYSRQKQPHLALYQYQVCVEALRTELDVEPAPETTQLHNRIRRREPV